MKGADMKYLNKNFPNSPLNKKLREIYKIKQEINNSKLENVFKDKMMKACDNEIHRCWELSHHGVNGYEID